MPWNRTWTCTKCNHDNSLAVEQCFFCGLPKDGSPRPESSEAQIAGATATTSPADRNASSVMNRYNDAYLVARSCAGIGKVISVIGLIVTIGGVLSFLVGLVSTGAPKNEATLLAGLLIPLGLVSAMGGLLLYCLGVFIGAHGQLLKATLDAAVNSSPFLTDSQRAKTMSL
jgi:hypothetical protein